MKNTKSLRRLGRKSTQKSAFAKEQDEIQDCESSSCSGEHSPTQISYSKSDEDQNYDENYISDLALHLNQSGQGLSIEKK
jgi:hypothetical protein